MGDLIRYLCTEANDVTLDSVETALRQIDPQFSIFRNQGVDNNGDLLYASDVYGEIEVNQAEDDVFREDIEELRDQLAGFDDEETMVVVNALDRTVSMVAFQLTESGHEHYKLIDPLWDWLFDHAPGLLQVDEEGYYTKQGQILIVE